MQKVLLIIVALSILILPSLTSAAQGRPGGYASVFLGVSLIDDTNVSTDEYDPFEPFIYTYNDRIEFDPGVYVGGTAGYDFGVIRLEGELSYRQNEMDTITDRDSGVKYSGVDGDVGVFAFMANVFVDLHNDSPITPYIGGGIGGATIYLSDTDGSIYGERLRLYSADDESVFAYQIGGGLDIALNRQTSLDIGYRYFRTETARFDSDWYQSKEFDLDSHNVAVGLRFKF
jgi:opacity protein-like surface antigen